MLNSYQEEKITLYRVCSSWECEMTIKTNRVLGGNEDRYLVAENKAKNLSVPKSTTTA